MKTTKTIKVKKISENVYTHYTCKDVDYADSLRQCHCARTSLPMCYWRAVETFIAQFLCNKTQGWWDSALWQWLPLIIKVKNRFNVGGSSLPLNVIMMKTVATKTVSPMMMVVMKIALMSIMAMGLMKCLTQVTSANRYRPNISEILEWHYH